MTAPITPALTAEEWAKLLRYQKESGERYIADGYGSQYFHELAYERCEKSQQAGHHLVAALALHGQPFGLTRDDVQSVQRVARWYDGWARKYASQAAEDIGDEARQACTREAEWYRRESNQLESLAARIEALLPPEGA